jgi:hypothetical protein
VADDDRLALAERADHSDDVADHVDEGVGVGGLRCGGAAVAAHIHGHRPESGCGDDGELIAPGVPGLGEAVAEDDQRPFADGYGVDRYAVGVNLVVLERISVHGGCLSMWQCWMSAGRVGRQSLTESRGGPSQRGMGCTPTSFGHRSEPSRRRRRGRPKLWNAAVKLPAWADSTCLSVITSITAYCPGGGCAKAVVAGRQVVCTLYLLASVTLHPYLVHKSIVLKLIPR